MTTRRATYRKVDESRFRAVIRYADGHTRMVGRSYYRSPEAACEAARQQIERDERHYE